MHHDVNNVISTLAPTDCECDESLQPNGLRVLEMIPGLLPKVSGGTADTLQFYSVEPSDPGLLASRSIIPEEGTIPYPFLNVIRPNFHAVILAEAQDVYGIPINYDHALIDLVENKTPTSTSADEEGIVTVYFSNGETDTASFVVGCDGLHSATRVALFGKEKPHFTGMIQVRFYLCHVVPCLGSIHRVGLALGGAVCGNQCCERTTVSRQNQTSNPGPWSGAFDCFIYPVLWNLSSWLISMVTDSHILYPVR